MGYVTMDFLGPSGARPLLDKVECNFPTTSYLTSTLSGISATPIPFGFTSGLEYYSIAQDNLVSLADSQIKLIYQDLPATRIRTPEKCP